MLALQNAYKSIFILFLLICTPLGIYSENAPQSFDDANTINELIENGVLDQNFIKKSDLLTKSKSRINKRYKKLLYYIYISDFISSFIEIPTSNVLLNSSTLSSKYLAGRAPVYNRRNEKVGTCSASFLCIQNEEGIYTDISNYLSINNGLIVSWFTPTTLINLELDSILHSMVTECLVTASTKIGFNPFYGKKFNMIVSSDDQKIYFELTEI